MSEFFRENFDVLSPVFCQLRKTPVEMKLKEEILNIHDAYVNELSETFMAKLGKDRIYQRVCGFVTDKQIWMIGVLVDYFVKHVMFFDHEDFLTAMKVDLGPILGETGLWALKNYEQRMELKGKVEKKNLIRNAHDLIAEYMENGYDKLGKLSTYNMKNKYCPKKMPAKAQTRASIPILYSWTHYAPLKWFQYIRGTEDSIKEAQKTNGASAIV